METKGEENCSPRKIIALVSGRFKCPFSLPRLKACFLILCDDPNGENSLGLCGRKGLKKSRLDRRAKKILMVTTV